MTVRLKKLGLKRGVSLNGVSLAKGTTVYVSDACRRKIELVFFCFFFICQCSQEEERLSPEDSHSMQTPSFSAAASSQVGLYSIVLCSNCILLV